MGSDLYQNLKAYFSSHLSTLKLVRASSFVVPSLVPPASARPLTFAFTSPSYTQASEPLHDLALLQYYAKEWDRYTTGANYVNRLFAYLNRHWVKREKDEGRKGIYDVYTVRLVAPFFFLYILF